MSNPSRVLIDMEAKYGVSTLTLRQQFLSGAAATKFIKDYCFNANKQCVVRKSSGRSKTYCCSSVGCTWEVRVTKKTSDYGVTYMSVTTLRDQHSDICMSLAKPTLSQIAALPSFQASIRADRKVKAKVLVSMVQAQDHTNLQGSRAQVYRAKDAVIDSLDGSWAESFGLIPSLLSELRRCNPGSTVSLDVDQHHRFLRCFFSFGVVVASQHLMMPVLGFDGTHFRNARYNGVILSLLGRDGNGENVTMATAIANVENEANVAWFLLKCIDAGVCFESKPLFCDRGCIRSAVRSIYATHNISIHLRFCTYHIINNVHSACGRQPTDCVNLIWKIQEAETERRYLSALDEMRSQYSHVASYIESIDARFWTVHANMTGYKPNLADPNMIPTETLALFDNRTSSFVESDNNVMLGAGIRDTNPLESIKRCVSLAMKRASKRDEQAQQWQEESRRLTPHAKLLWDGEKSKVGAYQVDRSSARVFFVSQAGASNPRRVEILATQSLRCSCSTFDQLQLPCRHITAVAQFCQIPDMCFNSFHKSYLVKAYTQAFRSKAVELATDQAFVVDSMVLPSPYYRQAGRRLSRRIASAGEVPGPKTHACSRCHVHGHHRSTCRRRLNEADELNRELIAIPVHLAEDETSQTASASVSASTAHLDSRLCIAYLLD